MRELHYGSGVITVSFDVCSAVFDYTVALANAGVTDRITVPVMNNGRRGFSNLLLGPQTQLYCTATVGDEHLDARPDAEEIDLDDAELVAALVLKTAALNHSVPLAASNGDLTETLADLD
ncbi:hypothetical protein [Subtercola sp. YIM 133946]|uniref:hypothetical protein n=1 Tax=Subtercola sp. YIM 133946 TaxID=3118909 RepID=UPI002F94EB22